MFSPQPQPPDMGAAIAQIQKIDSITNKIRYINLVLGWIMRITDQSTQQNDKSRINYKNEVRKAHEYVEKLLKDYLSSFNKLLASQQLSRPIGLDMFSLPPAENKEPNSQSTPNTPGTVPINPESHREQIISPLIFEDYGQGIAFIIHKTPDPRDPRKFINQYELELYSVENQGGYRQSSGPLSFKRETTLLHRKVQEHVRELFMYLLNQVALKRRFFKDIVKETKHFYMNFMKMILDGEIRCEVCGKFMKYSEADNAFLPPLKVVIVPKEQNRHYHEGCFEERRLG